MSLTNTTDILQGLHVGSGQFEGPLHRQRVEGRHSLTLYLQVQPGTGKQAHSVSSARNVCVCRQMPSAGQLSPSHNKQDKCVFHGILNQVLCRQMKQCVPISVILFEGWEGSQRVIKL